MFQSGTRRHSSGPELYLRRWGCIERGGDSNYVRVQLCSRTEGPSIATKQLWPWSDDSRTWLRLPLAMPHCLAAGRGCY